MCHGVDVVRPVLISAVFLMAMVATMGCQESVPPPQASALAPSSPALLQVGSMHETIGRKQHQGRIDLADALARPSFYGIGAVEGLTGEITILDSMALITTVAPDGGPAVTPPEGIKATLLVGASVESWVDATFDDVAADDVDAAVARAAESLGVSLDAPFVFMIDGEITDVRLHVINGACPIRARMKDEDIAAHERPLEIELEKVTGSVVGVHAEQAVGDLTHPATSLHAHLVFTDEESGQRITGHLEAFGLATGATLRVPQPVENGGH
jgi:alpha-acetolactate decarboxylase